MSENLFARRKITKTTIIRVNHAKKIHTKRGLLYLLNIPAPPLEPIVVGRKRGMAVLVDKVTEDHKKKLLPSQLNNNKVKKLNGDINQVNEKSAGLLSGSDLDDNTVIYCNVSI